MHDRSAPSAAPLAWLLRFVLVLSALLLGAEATSRWFLSTPRYHQPDPTFGIGRIPGSQVISSTEGYGRHVVDPVGNLDQPISGPVVHRVGLVGDSYAEAIQVDHGERFSEVVESLVPGLEVVNHARGGWNPAAYVAFAQRIDPSAHDVLLVLINDGDLMTLDQDGPISLRADPSGGFELAMREHPTRRSRLGRLASEATRRSALLNWIRQRGRLLVATEKARLGGTPATDPIEDASSTSLSPDEALARLVAIDGMLRDAHPHVVYLYVPTVQYGDAARRKYPDSEPLLDGLREATGAKIIDTFDAIAREYARTHQPLHGFHNSWMGRGHLNVRGHRVVAHVLARELEVVLP